MHVNAYSCPCIVQQEEEHPSATDPAVKKETQGNTEGEDFFPLAVVATLGTLCLLSSLPCSPLSSPLLPSFASPLAFYLSPPPHIYSVQWMHLYSVWYIIHIFHMLQYVPTYMEHMYTSLSIAHAHNVYIYM
jgi:hypothetical protein